MIISTTIISDGWLFARRAKQGGVDTALEAMLLSTTLRYLVTVLVEETTEDLWYLESLLYSAALILVVHVHYKHDHGDLFHRHRSNLNDRSYPPHRFGGLTSFTSSERHSISLSLCLLRSASYSSSFILSSRACFTLDSLLFLK